MSVPHKNGRRAEDSTSEHNHYQRPSASKIEGEARRKALAEYLDHYTKLAATDLSLLNQKLPKSAFATLLDRVGALLLAEAKRMSVEDPVVTTFLNRNPVPECLGSALTPEVRTFCLALQALSQWTTAEKLAMDRFVFSGRVRSEIRAAAKGCPILPDGFDTKKIELHHPVRDGRPPIPLSKRGHEKIEGVMRPDEGDADGQRLFGYKIESKSSWVRIRLGCLIALDQIDLTEGQFAQGYVTDSKMRFRKAMEATGLSAERILDLLNRYSLGEIAD